MASQYLNDSNDDFFGSLFDMDECAIEGDNHDNNNQRSPFSSQHAQYGVMNTIEDPNPEDFEFHTYQKNVSTPIPIPNPPTASITVKEKVQFKLEDMRDALDGIVNKYGTYVTLRKFKREAGMAWQRKFPTATLPQGAFQAFIKSTIGNVRDENPNASHQEHMRLVGKMWADNKKSRFYQDSHNQNQNITGQKRTVDEV